MKKAVMYGAGNIGRGFIGQIFYQSGYEVTFIDTAEPVIEALNLEKRYPIRILNNVKRAGLSHEDIWIEGVKAVNGKNEEEAAQAIADADIMATAVGVRALPFIVPVIAAGLKKRFAKTVNQAIAPLNLIICENLIDANTVFERLIKEHLDEEGRKKFDEQAGLVKASIGRMVPLQTKQMQDGNPLRVCVEAYGFLPVDKTAFKGEIPSLVGMYPFDNFDLYIQRKLFIHNMGHAICAYFGMIRGDTYIYETAAHPGILYIAHNAMLESALALLSKYNASLPELHWHIRDLLQRFTNEALADTCARVGADITRKLGNRDRFIGALLCSTEAGITPAFISAGTAAALYCHLKENNVPQSRDKARGILAEITGLAGDAAEAERILSYYMLLAVAQDGHFEEAINEIINFALIEGHKEGIV